MSQHDARSGQTGTGQPLQSRSTAGNRSDCRCSAFEARQRVRQSSAGPSVGSQLYTSMIVFQWDKWSQARLDEIKTNLASVSTASACQLLISLGWRNTYMLGIRPLQALGLGTRIVGRARTCRYLMRREAEAPIDAETRRRSPEIQLIESIVKGDIFCVDALGLQTAG